MIKIALVVPNKDFIENAAEIFHSHNKTDSQYDGEEYVLEEVIANMENVRNLKIEADVIISRGLFAQMMNINFVPLKTSRETFWQAISTVKNAVQITRNEQKKSSRLKAILDSSKEGILSVDQNWRINIVNQSALSIVQLPLNALNDQYIKHTKLPEELKEIIVDQNEYSDKVIPFNGSLLNVNKSLIRVKNDVVGAVVAFQKIENIQAVEYKLRKTMFNKGHIAKATFADVTGTSPAITNVVEQAKGFSCTDSNILLIGESGTGKELFAQSIHNHSCRKNGPFVAVNCAAIPDTLLESELFGYVSGAFTGAAKCGKTGYFELAHNGTIFLDEIAEIPLTLQPKLLRVLQEREIMRLGDGRLIPVDIRIIAATNRDLEKLSLQDKFRQDLFFRLDVLRINLPSLNDRKQDISLLVEAYLQKKFPHISIEANAMNLLINYNWYGNIRQLFNVCERIAVLKQDNTIRKSDVIVALHGDASSIVTTPQQESERAKVLNALIAAKYNRAQAAELLNINRSTLWRKMKEYNL